MDRKSVFIGLLMLSLMTIMGVKLTLAATYDVDMGKTSPPCGGAGTSDIGFVDCTSGTGGIGITATTAISAGDTVRWTMRSIPHTTTSEGGLTGGPNAPCAWGDSWDSGLANAFTPGFVFTHTFTTPANVQCYYFCIIHPTLMQGIIILIEGTTTTVTTTTSTTTTTTTTINTSTTTTTTTTSTTCNTIVCGTTSTTSSTTTTRPPTTTTTISTTTTTTCNDKNNDQNKDKGKGHDKGKCKGHDKDK